MAHQELYDTAATVEVLTSLQNQVEEWKKRMNAAHRLGDFYQKSPFAKSVISEREKEFKRKYWEASQLLTQFKRNVLGEK